MKTPGEILLQRHQNMEAKLNAVRHRALAAAIRPGWLEVGVSIRWHLAGLGAVWLLVLILNADAASDSTMTLARANIPSPRVILNALLENRKELMQLTESAPAEPVAIPPRRSQISTPTEMV